MRRHVSLLLSEQLSQSAAAQHLGQLFFVVVAGCTSATYYNLIAMPHFHAYVVSLYGKIMIVISMILFESEVG